MNKEHYNKLRNGTNSEGWHYSELGNGTKWEALQRIETTANGEILQPMKNGTNFLAFLRVIRYIPNSR